MYDEDTNKRLPGFHYFLARGLARFVKTEDENEKLFASPSNSEAWKKQGDYFWKKSLYQQAVFCYGRACEPQLQYNYAAVYWFNLASSRNDEQLYRASAAYFLQAEDVLHQKGGKITQRIDFIRKAAKCLKDGECHYEAAMLYEAIGKVHIISFYVIDYLSVYNNISPV